MTINKITSLMTDTAILTEMGQRLARVRINNQLTQAALAEQAGVSKRTIERIEAGESAQLSSLIRILRILDLLAGIDMLLPEAGPRPMDLLKLQGKVRRRASSPRSAPENSVRKPRAWTWNDDDATDQK